MLRLQWTAEEVTRLQDLRRHHPNPRVRRKAEAVYLKSLNLPHHEIARIVGVTEKTARSYLQAYAAGGIDALSAVVRRNHQSALYDHVDTIRAAFTDQPPATINEAVARIETLTGLRRSPTQVRDFVNKTGLSGARPGKSRPKRTPRFKETSSITR